MPENFELPLPTEEVDWGEVTRAVNLFLKMREAQEQSRAAAERYQAEQEYRDMLTQGEDPMSALRKVAPRLYSGSPTGLASAMRYTQEPRSMIRGSPSQGFYQINPDGTVTNIMEGTKEERQQMDVSDKEELSDINREMRETARLIGKLNLNKAYWTPEERSSYSDATNTVAELKRDKAELMQKYGGAPPSPSPLSGGLTPPPIGQGASPLEPTPSPSGVVRLRRKSDGKIFRYKGNPEDVPRDQYDLL